ncbi:MAG: YybS family protein [Limnochordia bacterium]|nr:YybS family protein [Bacillota bacterium]
MPRHYDTRSITEGAMLAAITFVLSFLGAYVFPYVFFIVPVPLVILVYRHGLRLGILVTVVAAILAGLLIDIMTMVVLLLVAGLVGISIGGALREQLPPQKVFALGVAASLIAYALLLFFSQTLFQVNVVDLLMDSFRHSIDQVTALYSKMGMSEEQLGEARTMLENMMNLARMVLPVTFLLSAIGLTFVDYWLARSILGRLGSKMPWFPPFRSWRFPWYLAWGYILGLGLPLISSQGVLFAVAANLQVFFTYVFMVQGLAVLWFFFDEFGVSRPLRVFILILIFLPRWPLSRLLVWTGVIDTWLDIRKLEGMN